MFKLESNQHIVTLIQKSEPLYVFILFKVDYGMSVELNILEYDLEGAANCRFDYLEVKT